MSVLSTVASLTLPFGPFPTERSCPKPFPSLKINELMENAGPAVAVCRCVCVCLVGISVSKQRRAILGIAL